MISVVFAVAAMLAADAPADESISVTVVGTIRTGIVAIGGETTGTTITSKDVTWELDFRKNAHLGAAAEDYSGQRRIYRGKSSVQSQAQGNVVRLISRPRSRFNAMGGQGPRPA